MYPYFYHKKPVKLMFVSGSSTSVTLVVCTRHGCVHIVLLQSKRDGVADISTTEVYATSL